MDNNEKKIVIAGFGGQGIVVVGNIIARAAVIEGLHVVGMVCYGAEMRGGTANATVIVSDELIFNPVVTHPDYAIILNNPSLDRFEPMVASGGMALLNRSMITRSVDRSDIGCIQVDASRIAHEMGNTKVTNIVALGAFIEHTKLLSLESITQGIKDLFSQKNTKLVEMNLKALNEGAVKSSCMQPVEQT